MRALILFILDWVRQRVDKDYAADLAKYQARGEKQRELVEYASAALVADTEKYLGLQIQRDQLTGQIEAVKAEVAELERLREEVRSERQTKLADLSRVSDDDLRRQPL